MTVRVALADDSLFVREGIVRMLAEPGGEIEVVAECGDAVALLEAVERTGPRVVVTDIRMPPTHTDEGVRLAAELRLRHPDLGVVVLSNYADPAYVLAVLRSGAERRAYLLKERVTDRAQLRSAILTVAAGGSLIDPKIVEPLVGVVGDGAPSRLSPLTARERDVLAGIASGSSNGAIAESLVLTKRAVEKHINAIFLKLGLTDEHDVSKRVTATLLFLAEMPAARQGPASVR